MKSKIKNLIILGAIIFTFGLFPKLGSSVSEAKIWVGATYLMSEYGNATPGQSATFGVIGIVDATIWGIGIGMFAGPVGGAVAGAAAGL